MKNFRPEILAPVGSYEMLEAAVRSGADAVYFGAENFNARRNAENFSDAELKNVIEYCRIRKVKSYLTLNIMLRDDEIEKALGVAQNAYKFGITGIIVADLGLAYRLNKQFPKLPIHASTQLSVHSVSALPYLKKAGFKRVVVSREMSADAIKEFCAKAKSLGLETEVFVHGALCMSLSGQCLLSAAIGGRSGNRGLCAGPCRLPFKNENSEYALSLKDLSLLEYANELADMGVASLKIEGRMKRPEYVAAAVAAFKARLENGDNADLYAENLQNVFSRSGFTSGYYTQKTGDFMFGVRTKNDVTATAEVLSQIHSLYRSELQSVPLSIKARVFADEPVYLGVFDGINKAEAFGNIPETAKNKSIDSDTVKAYVSKLGGTPYYAENVTTEIQNGLFVSGAELNALRRRCIEQLTSLRAAQPEYFKCEYYPEYPRHFADKTEIYCRFESISQIPENLSEVSVAVLPLECDISGVNLPQGVKTAVELPRGILNEKIIANKLNEFKSRGVNIAFCGTLAAKQLAENAGFNVIGDMGFNIYNSDAAFALQSSGVKGIVLSPELKADELTQIKTPLKTGFFAYGRLPLMLTLNCPVKAGDCSGCRHNRFLTDRMGMNFPVRCRNGFSEIFNCKPHFLADKKSDFCGVDFMYLYFTFETKEEAADIINAYIKGQKPKGEFTRGLYYRGVM